MIQAIKLGNSPYISTRLCDILRLIPAKDKGLNWYVLELTASGDIGENMTIIDLIKEIDSAKNGKQFSYQDLLLMSLKLHNVDQCLVIGCEDNNYFTIKDSLDNIKNGSEYVIDYFDSNYWEISSKNVEFIKNLKSFYLDSISENDTR